MTEAEWLNCTDPQRMLEFIRGQSSDRKLRLFAVACCRRIWNVFTHPDAKTSVEVAEQFAEGTTSSEELRSAHELAMWAGDDASWRSMQIATTDWAAAAASHKESHSAAGSAVYEIRSVYAEDKLKRDEERLAQCHLLCDVFGNLFHGVVVCPAWLAWNDGTIRKMAQSTYDARAFGRLTLLADALEDAGCTDAAVLSHCREPGEHVRGCWVVDLLLGKS